MAGHKLNNTRKETRDAYIILVLMGKNCLGEQKLVTGEYNVIVSVTMCWLLMC
jgi:hypothetical protein